MPWRYTHAGSLRPLDLEAMAALHQQVNLVPVIAKADSLTIEERQAFKKRVRSVGLISTHPVAFFPSLSVTLSLSIHATCAQRCHMNLPTLDYTRLSG